MAGVVQRARLVTMMNLVRLTDAQRRPQRAARTVQRKAPRIDHHAPVQSLLLGVNRIQDHLPNDVRRGRGGDDGVCLVDREPLDE